MGLIASKEEGESMAERAEVMEGITQSLPPASLARSYSKRSEEDEDEMPIQPLPGVPTTLQVLFDYLRQFVHILSNFVSTYTPVIHISLFLTYLRTYSINFVPEFVMALFDQSIRDINGDPFEKQLGDKTTPTLMKMAYLTIPRRLREIVIRIRMSKYTRCCLFQ